MPTHEDALERVRKLYRFGNVQIFELAYDDADLQEVETTAGGQRILRLARCTVTAERDLDV